MIREIETKAASGLSVLLIFLVVSGLLVYGLISSLMAGADENALQVIGYIVGIAVVTVLYFGFFVVNPNEGKVLQLFGKYVGTVRDPGLRWANPFYTKQRVSLRVRNFETSKMKVNDNRGNPVEIAAVVVWKVVDTAEAIFEVDDYVNYVHVQSEAATRNLATQYPYDAFDEDERSLVGDISEISEKLKHENQDRLEKAGIKIIETRISHLAYSPEIAQAMLRRQQAHAIIAARRKIVEGAVGMVEHALEELSRKGVLNLDEERKASMVSNLLVVLCSEHETQPVVNTGSLYS
jgi:regulator of protease activity HflC (stomatin/prohibitin superfamily)